MSEQIALIEVPIRETTDARSLRLAEEWGHLTVLGQSCQIVRSLRHLEFLVGGRRFEISLEELIEAAGAAIAGHLKAAIADRVRAQGRGAEAAAALAAAADRLPRRVPTGKPWIARVRYAQGWTVADIARTLHVTDVTVRAYLKAGPRAAPDPRQMPLL
jgi:hypothetical protein